MKAGQINNQGAKGANEARDRPIVLGGLGSLVVNQLAFHGELRQFEKRGRDSDLWPFVVRPETPPSHRPRSYTVAPPLRTVERVAAG